MKEIIPSIEKAKVIACEFYPYSDTNDEFSSITLQLDDGRKIVLRADIYSNGEDLRIVGALK